MLCSEESNRADRSLVFANRHTQLACNQCFLASSHHHDIGGQQGHRSFPCRVSAHLVVATPSLYICCARCSDESSWLASHLAISRNRWRPPFIGSRACARLWLYLGQFRKVCVHCTEHCSASFIGCGNCLQAYRSAHFRTRHFTASQCSAAKQPVHSVSHRRPQCHPQRQPVVRQCL